MNSKEFLDHGSLEVRATEGSGDNQWQEGVISVECRRDQGHKESRVWARHGLVWKVWVIVASILLE
jgi:hypothetical protein